MQRFVLFFLVLTGCSDTDTDGKDGDVNNEPSSETSTEPSSDTSDEEVIIDSDSDGLTDDQEAELGTDPNNADTDGDGVNDGLELNLETDPTDASSFPIKPDNGDWLLTDTSILLDDCNLESLLATFGSDIFVVLPDDYSIVNSSYESFEIEISSGNANCPIDQSGFVCDTLSITETIDDVNVTISVDVNLEGTLNNATSMEAILSATLTNCDGDACSLLSFANVNIPCDVRIGGQGNL